MSVFRKYKMRRWKYWGVTLFAITIVLLIDVFLSYILGTCNLEHPSMVQNQWYYQTYYMKPGMESEEVWSPSHTDKSWHSVEHIGDSIKNGSDNIIFYKTIMPDSKMPDPCMLLQTNDQAFEVYLDNQKLYTFGNFDDFNFKHSPGAPLHLISLPENYQGKELIIAMKAISDNKLGLIRAIEFDSKSNHITRVFKMNISTMILGCLGITLGTLCMLIGVIRKLGRKALLSLGFSFVIVGLWSISENALTQMFHFRPLFWYYVAVVSFYLIPTSVYMFIRDISKTDKRIYGHLIHIHIFIFILSMLLDITGLVPLINTLIFHYIFLGISYITCIYISGRSYLRGNKKALIYTLGLLMFGLAGLYDILGWYFEFFSWKINIATWGMFVFQLGLAYVLVEYIRDVQDRFVLYKEKIRDNKLELRQKDKQIDEVLEHDKIRTEFFGNISHELRTPLNIISSTIQLISMYRERGYIECSEKGFDKYVGMMGQNCNRLLKLVNNIIDITKIDSGYFKLEMKNLNIVCMIENITMSIVEYANNKGVSLTFDTEVEDRVIACDPDAVERIMLNLLSNAIKFSNAGASVNVILKNFKNNICIEVTDTGIGIPHDKVNRVFERFVQVDKSFTRQHEGSGIGLALAKSLVEMHQGSISLESELGKGSKFTIVLPAIVLAESKDLSVTNSYCSKKMERVQIEFSDVL